MKRILIIFFILSVSMMVINQPASANGLYHPDQFPWGYGSYEYPYNMEGYPGMNCEITAFDENQINLSADIFMTQPTSVSQQFVEICFPTKYILRIMPNFPYATANTSSYLSISQKNAIRIYVTDDCDRYIASEEVAGLVAATANPMYAVFAVTLDDASLRSVFPDIVPVGIQQAGAGFTYSQMADLLMNSGWFMPLKKGKWVGQCMAFAPQK